MFRFTIRDLLWLMVVVALAAGWWAERSRADLAVRRMREHSSRTMGLVGEFETVLRLWEHDVPGTVGREKGGGLYYVDTKQGRRYFHAPFLAPFLHEIQSQPEKR